jgi:hypothetical protein
MISHTANTKNTTNTSNTENTTNTKNTTNTTYMQILFFKLSFPFININSLVQIPSRIKTPNVIELMNINDYEMYKIQQKKEMN